MNNKFEYKYFEYEMYLYMFPQDENDILKIREELDHINKTGKYHLNYGVFALTDMDELKAFFKNVIITVGYLNGEPAIMTYQILLINDNFPNLPVLHQGLILCAKNPGREIQNPILIGTCFYQHFFGDVYVTTLVADPWFIGLFSRTYDNPFPSPYANNQFPVDKQYYSVATVCYESYVLKHFTSPQDLSYDLKRFVIKTKSKDMGFETDMRKMKRDSETLVNVFSMFWLNYDEQEVMLQVGKVNSTIVQNAIEKFNLGHILKDPIISEEDEV